MERDDPLHCDDPVDETPKPGERDDQPAKEPVDETPKPVEPVKRANHAEAKTVKHDDPVHFDDEAQEPVEPVERDDQPAKRKSEHDEQLVDDHKEPVNREPEHQEHEEVKREAENKRPGKTKAKQAKAKAVKRDDQSVKRDKPKSRSVNCVDEHKPPVKQKSVKVERQSGSETELHQTTMSNGQRYALI